MLSKSDVTKNYLFLMAAIKKHFYLLLLIPVICYLFSLWSRHTHMNNNDIAWMEVYQVKDKRLFTFGNVIDTMYICNKDVWNSRSLFWKGPIGGEYHAGGYYDYVIIHEGDSLEGYFAIEKEHKRYPVSLSFQLQNRFAFNIAQEFHIVRLNNIIYYDCIVISHNNSQSSTYIKNNTIKTLTWCKSKGLIEYELTDGKKYQLIP